MDAKTKFLKHITSKAGKIGVTAMFAAIIWGLFAIALASKIMILTYAIVIICMFFGWKSLKIITINMFSRLNFLGGMIYFMVKGMISAVIGVFVAPIKIASMLSDYSVKKMGKAESFTKTKEKVKEEIYEKQTEMNSPEIITESEKKKLTQLGEIESVLMAHQKAVNGDPKAMEYLGLTYATVLDIPEKAFYWIEEATKKGSISAQYVLGTYYGSGYGVEENKVMAVDLIIHSADMGNNDAIDFCINKFNMTKEQIKNYVEGNI